MAQETAKFIRKATATWTPKSSPLTALFMVLLVTTASVPRIYIWIAQYQQKRQRQKKQKRVLNDNGSPYLPMLQQLHTSTPWFGLRSQVRTQASPDSIRLPSKGSDTVSLSELVVDNVPLLENGTWSLMHPGLFSGHLQTMFASLPSETVNKIHYGRRCVYWDDGSLVTADYLLPDPKSDAEWKKQAEYCPLNLEDDKFPRPPRLRYLTPEEITAKKNAPAEKPLLVLLHGLSGGSHETYIRSTIDQISKSQYGAEGEGFDCVVLNSRGCAGTPITTPQLFCAIWTDDIRRFIKLLRSEEDPNNRRRIYIVGFSLGASILSNFLGQQGFETSKPESRVDAAVVVANPWDLNHSNQFLSDSYIGYYLYSPVMANSLVRLMNRHQPGLGQSLPHIYGDSYEKTQDVSSLREFDETFTAPFFGFHSARDYYRSASSVHRLLEIRTPTLIVNALDDPIVHKDCIPYTEAYLNPYVVLSTTSLGGHLGWFTPKGNRHRWFPEMIASFFDAFDKVVDHSKEVKKQLPKRPERLMRGDRLVMAGSVTTV